MQRGQIFIDNESREQLLTLPNLPKEFKDKLLIMNESNEILTSEDELEKIIDLLPPAQSDNNLRAILTKQLQKIT